MAFERQDWEQAINAWQLLKQRLPENSSRYQAVVNALENAKSQQEKSEVELKVTVKLSDEMRRYLPAEGTVLFTLQAQNSLCLRRLSGSP